MKDETGVAASAAAAAAGFIIVFTVVSREVAAEAAAPVSISHCFFIVIFNFDFEFLTVSHFFCHRWYHHINIASYRTFISSYHIYYLVYLLPSYLILDYGHII